MTYGKLLASAMTATLALGTALPALAENGSDDASSSTSSVSSSSSSKMPRMIRGDMMRNKVNEVKKSNKKFDGTCVKPLVEAREKALAAGWTTFSASMTTAFSTRSTALSSAWALTDTSARNAAIKAAWQAFAKSGKTAREAWKTAQKNARQTFRTGAKACGISSTDASLNEPENDVNVGE